MSPRPLRHLPRARLLLGVSAVTLLAAAPAVAGSNNPFARVVDPGAAAAAAAQAQASQSAVATAASQQALAAFAKAAVARQNMDAAQQAARAAAAAQSGVANGLGPGGLNGDPTLWTNANAPTQTTASNGRTEVDIVQTGAKAILNWTSFNVGQNTDLVFNQQGNASWVALNRVNDPSANPTQILGAIKAPGTILIMNHNGIIFGGASQVNVGALVASTLDITDAQFLKGIVNPQAYDALHQRPFDPIFANTSGGVAGDVTVMPGAQIQTAAPTSVTTGGGFVYLFGQNVTNGGSITTPDGQAVLAAGDAVYISQSTDPNVRGVEINLGVGGKVANAANALVDAPTGNVMLVGHDIEQDGVLLASTSIDEAGSISLIAHDGITTQTIGSSYPPVILVIPTRTGAVDLAPGSLTAVLPEEDGRTALSAQPQGQSVIKVEGASVSVLGGATVLAPAGQVTLRASLDPVTLYEQDNPSTTGLTPTLQSSQDNAPVYVADGAVIDVSGLQNVPVAASDDVVEVHVTGNELRDSPLQRGGILNGDNVWVNVHDLNTVASDQIYTAGGLLEVSGFLGLIPYTIDQRLTTGGSVNISAGQTILRPGATINIAGGTLDHEGGYVNITLLRASDGQIYDINNAPADLTYTQVGDYFTENHPRWGVSDSWSSSLVSQSVYDPAYVQGKDAGSLSVNGRLATEMDADVYADAANGVYQRSAGSMAHSGSLFIGPQIVGTTVVGDRSVLIAPSVTAPNDPFAGGPASSDPSGGADLLPPDYSTVLRLSADKLDQAHYGSITIIGDGGAGSVVDPGTGKTLPSGVSVVDGATLKVADGGSISLESGSYQTAGTITIDGQLIAHGGSITLTGDNASPQPVPNAGDKVVLAPNAEIDVTGVWTNDLLDPADAAPALYDGGDVTINARSIQIGQGALIDASGGGWLQSNGQLKTDSNGLPLGTGGNITLITNNGGPTTQFGQTTRPTYPGALVLGGMLRSNGLHGGGELTLAAPAIQIGGADPVDGQTLWLDPSFFSQNGFGAYRLIAYNGLTVEPGADIELHAQILLPNGALAQVPTGSSIEGVVSLGAPQLFQQAAPVNLALSADDTFTGDLALGAGAQINADPGASVSLHASDQLTIEGRIYAPGGTINLDLVGMTSDGGGDPAPAYNPARTLWIGADAQLLAPGLVQTFLYPSGLPGFRLWSGGGVNINENGGDAQYYPYSASAFFGLVNIGPTGSVVGLAGSVIDVSGVAGEITMVSGRGLSQDYSTVPVATDAGSLAINGAQGLFLDTTLLAHAGGPSAAGGSLTLEQSLPVASSFVAADYPTPVGELILTQKAQSFVPAGLKLGDALPADQQGQVHASADAIMGAGFDAMTLSAVDAVVFDGNVNLNAARSITLSTSAISATPGAQVNLSSAYVDIGGGRLNSLTTHQNGYLYGYSPVLPLAGTAELTVNADLIDFEGSISSGAVYSYQPNSALPTVTVALPGFAAMNFNSTGDIRLVPSQINYGVGHITTLGDITLISAQIYPITSAPTSGVVGNPLENGLTVISATGPDSVITIARNSDDIPPPPLSAGGQVQFIAPTINQGGVLRAPMGQITFGDPNNPSAAATINLLPGSITSVSANGLLIPYGGPLGDAQYIYGYNGYVNGESGVPAPYTISAPLQKEVSFYGQSVNVAGAAGGQAAAKIDESGGGDLFGFQFVSGTGGSVDVLNGVNTFAILPSLGSAYAPRSPLMDSSSATNPSAAPVNLKVGDQVYLSGYAGLPAGYYTLLPGHYALLPGAYELTVATSGLAPSQIAPNRTTPTGSYFISGYGAVANTSVRDALGSEYVVTPNSVVLKEAQYTETTLTQFFQAQASSAGVAAPRLPLDAGQLVIDAVNSIDFQGQGDFSVPTGGRGGLADIVGNQIEVLGPGDTLSAGFTGVSDSLISNVGAQSILIGGVRTITQADGSGGANSRGSLTIGQQASSVEIGSHAVLNAPEIMLRATSSLVLDPGAVIDTTGAGAIPDAFPSDPKTGLSSGTINLNGGAFLLASNAPSTIPIALTASGPSSLTIGAGARVDAAGSLALANQSNFSLDPTASFGAPSVTIAAPVIGIGGAGSSGLNLSNALLSALTHGDPGHGVAPTTLLTLSAGQEIDIYSGAQLGAVDPSTGAPTLAKLALAAPSIQGFGAAGDTASITAAQLMLAGGAASSSPTGTGQGSLSLNATELTLGAGDMGFGGFSTVNLNASAQVIGSGIGAYSTTGDLTISTPLVTGAAGADTTLNATGSVVFGPSPTAPAARLTQVQSIGAHLTVNAASITQGTDISLPSGVVNLNGAAVVTLASGSTTDVSGALTTFFDVVRISPAGTVNLGSQTGDVDIASGAIVNLSGGDLAAVDRTAVPNLDVTASDAGGDAGTLNIVATNGAAHLDGVLKTTFVSGYAGAKASLDLGSGDGGGLLTALQGFSGEQALMLATGDIAVGNLKAQDVELSAATGNLTVAGLIDASGSNGGYIRLTAGNNLTLEGGASLDAHATSSGGDPGSVFLGIGGASTGQLTLASGSRIDVAGSGPNGGKVWLRAPRVGVDAVAITDGGVTVTGATEIDVEAVAVTDISGDPYVDQNLAAADAAAQAYIANTSTIEAGIGPLASAPNFHLLPGIEFDSTGDITLLQSPSSTNTGVDLHTYRYNGEPMALTLRAAGDINMDGSLSDGFEGPVSSPDGNIFAIAEILPQGSRSASISLTAGADLAAADLGAVVAASSLPAGSGSIVFNDPHTDQSGAFLIPSVLRTGTGDLTLAAARDIDLVTPFGIYTAGTPSSPVANFTPPTRQYILSQTTYTNDTYLGYDPNTYQSYDSEGYPTALYVNYPEKGGDLRVSVGGNLTSSQISPAPNPNFSGYAGSEVDTYWLWTMGQQLAFGTPIVNGTSFINFGTYYQTYWESPWNSDEPPTVAAFLGLGALGGGDANIRVGGNLSNVDVALPATLRTPTGATSMDQVVVTGGGNLNLLVSGNLSNSNIMVGRGSGDVHATDIGAGYNADGNSALVEVEPGDARITVTSDRTLDIIIGDPTRAGLQYGPDNTFNGVNGLPFGLEGTGGYGVPVEVPYGFFSSYTDDTTLNAYSLGGDIQLNGDYVPPIMDIVADAGSISSRYTLSASTNATGNSGFPGGNHLFVALPSPLAQVDLYAGKDIDNTGVSMTGIEPISSADTFEFDYAPTIFNFTELDNSTTPSNLVQPDDPRTVHVYALGSLNQVTLATSKQADIRAGLDILSPIFEIQNNRNTDVSVVQAGRDIGSCGPLGSGACLGFNIRIAGPGQLEVEAGRDVTIEALILSGSLVPTESEGVSSIGNLDNALLPATGASISIGVGLGQKGPDIADFISTYFDPANASGVIQSYSSALLAYMQAQESNPGLTIGQALADFRALSSQQQLPLVEQVYYDEIKAGGRVAAAGGGAGGAGWDRAYKAIETLFPGSTPGTPTTAYQGDLSVYQLGRIRTEAGGDIDILAPGGGVSLGIENQTPDLTGDADTARPGILTLRQGDINIFTDRSVVVAQSRVFTELGGDILMFSDDGDLNAGKGKQTTISTAPAQFTVTPYGQVTKSPVTPQTGAGIATLIGVPGVKPGDVDLFAPHGTIDAGDAGIRVSGNLNIAALKVINAANIDVQGTTTGLPTEVAVNTGALTAASAASAAVTQVAQQIEQDSQPKTPPAAAPILITVQVLGFGEDNEDNKDNKDK